MHELSELQQNNWTIEKHSDNLGYRDPDRFKGSNECIIPLKTRFGNSEDPDVIQHYVAFNQGLHCLLRLKQSS